MSAERVLARGIDSWVARVWSEAVVERSARYSRNLAEPDEILIFERGSAATVRLGDLVVDGWSRSRARAVRIAFDIRGAVGELGLAMRTGIHTGEVS